MACSFYINWLLKIKHPPFASLLQYAFPTPEYTSFSAFSPHLSNCISSFFESLQSNSGGSRTNTKYSCRDLSFDSTTWQSTFFGHSIAAFCSMPCSFVFTDERTPHLKPFPFVARKRFKKMFFPIANR